MSPTALRKIRTTLILSISPTRKERRSWPNSVRFAYHTTSQLEK